MTSQNMWGNSNSADWAQEKPPTADNISNDVLTPGPVIPEGSHPVEQAQPTREFTVKPTRSPGCSGYSPLVIRFVLYACIFLASLVSVGSIAAVNHQLIIPF